MKCEKCKDTLSKSEQKEMREAQEYCNPRIICNECFEMEENQLEQDYEQHSDADMGL